MDVPVISIIIATYNRGESLIRTLNSVVRQDIPASVWEVVAVNNNSSDDTRKLFESFAAGNSGYNLRMVDEARQGLSPARNKGIEKSRGDIIAVIDDDQLVNESFARAYIEFFDSHTDVAACGGVITPLYESRVPGWMSKYTERPIAGTVDMGDRPKEFGGSSYPGGGNMAIRRSALERYGAFDPALGRTGAKLLGGEEKDLFRRLREGGEQIWYVPGAVVRHIIPASKLTAQYLMKLSRMVGVSERTRTLGVSVGAYLSRVVSEFVKWIATLVLLVGYALRFQPLKGWYLVRMRRQITLGLLCGRYGETE